VQILILSDIHSNLTALEAVLNDAGDFQEVWCLGDVVGYGPDPNACITTLNSISNLICIRGNHDAAVLGMIDKGAFNWEARISLEWQRKQLTEECLEFLEKLPEKYEKDRFILAHGSPRNPVWEYIMDTNTAQWNMQAFDSKFCLVGHSHIAGIFSQKNNSKVFLKSFALNKKFQLENKSIINPGSVGQPRDRDIRASYMIYETDDESFEYRRVAYDVETVVNRILGYQLPLRHAYRLKEGY
jgi:diadenosine tetraphosphatase ApaH/serine/threonine PP2A family protein phosphatase